MANINVTRSSMPDFDEYCEEIRDLWDTRWLTNAGAKHQELQRSLQSYFKVPEVVLYTNGHLALEEAIAAMGFSSGSEVITTPFTFVSTTNAIARNGLRPVFCDVNDSDYTMDVTNIEGLITKKTVAIVPVHVYGNLCDTDAIETIAKKYGLKVIYDAAHAFGVTKNGISSACFGDATMFSFHATKVFNTIEGGAVCCHDASLRENLEQRRNFGLNGQDDCIYAGGNAKMNEFQAAMGICNLRHIEGEIEKRREAVALYRALLSGSSGIRLCAEQTGVKSNYAYFPVVFDGYKYTRDEVLDRLKANGIMARKYFYPLTNEMTCYRNCAFEATAGTPVASYLAQRVLTLPLYAGLTQKDVTEICRIVCE